MKLLLSALVTVIALASFSNAHAADGNWKKKHPRREEVLQRDKNLKNRTQAADQSGKITDAQAQKLEKQEGAIRNQEQADAATHGGHITKGEKRDLNREENRVNRELKRDERRDAKRPSPTAPTTPPASTN